MRILCLLAILAVMTTLLVAEDAKATPATPKVPITTFEGTFGWIEPVTITLSPVQEASLECVAKYNLSFDNLYCVGFDEWTLATALVLYDLKTEKLVTETLIIRKKIQSANSLSTYVFGGRREGMKRRDDQQDIAKYYFAINEIATRYLTSAKCWDKLCKGIDEPIPLTDEQMQQIVAPAPRTIEIKPCIAP